MISPAEAMVALAEPRSERLAKGKGVIYGKDSCPTHCWGKVGQMIVAIQGICKENR